MSEKLVEVKDLEISFGEGSKKFVAVKNANFFINKGELYSIPGTPPSLYTELKGDAFALRSDYAMKIDFEEKAPQFAVSDTHWAKTWLLHEQAPKVSKPAVIEDLHDKIREKMGFAHLED